MTKPRTKKSPTSSSGKSTDVRPQVATPKRSEASVALAGAEFSASEIGAAVLADPLLVDCYRAMHEEGGADPMGVFVVWQMKRGLHLLTDQPPLLAWDKEKADFLPAPRLDAYRLRRRKADAEPVLVGEGWDEAFAELIVDVVKDRVRQAERCPAAGA